MRWIVRNARGVRIIRRSFTFGRVGACAAGSVAEVDDTPGLRRLRDASEQKATANRFEVVVMCHFRCDADGGTNSCANKRTTDGGGCGEGELRLDYEVPEQNRAEPTKSVWSQRTVTLNGHWKDLPLRRWCCAAICFEGFGGEARFGGPPFFMRRWGAGLA